MDKERLSQALDTAPDTLVRTSPSSLLHPQVFGGEVHALQLLGRLSPSTVDLANRLGIAALNTKLVSTSVAAQEVFKLGLDIPKNVHDHSGYWYTGMVDEFCRFIIEQRCGRKEVNFHDHYSPQWNMRFAREQFQNKATIALSRGEIWEFGVVIESKHGKLQTNSISIPYDGSFKPWHERLTSPEVFVGREEYLDVFSRMLTGKSWKQNALEAAFNTTDQELWWQQVAQSNMIVRGQYEAVRQRVGPSFSQRIISLLRTNSNSYELHHSIQEAQRI